MYFPMVVDPDALQATAVKLGEIATTVANASQNSAPAMNRMKNVVPPGKDVVSQMAQKRLNELARHCQSIVSEASRTLQGYANYLTLSAAAYSNAEATNTKTVT